MSTRPEPSNVPSQPASIEPLRLYGLLITKDDHTIFDEWCADQLSLYDAVVCLDGSSSTATAQIAGRYAQRLIYLHERDFTIPHKTDHGLRRVVHEEIVRRFGAGHWIMCCHADEFCYHDPRKIAQRAQREGFDQVAWFSPHFYPHPDELSDWPRRRVLPVRECFRHYHWSLWGDGYPWLEDRLYRADPGIAWDDHTHGTVRPHGLQRLARFHPILCHYKVIVTDPDWYEHDEHRAHYRHHWQGLPARTGLPYPVRRFEDLFVRSVPKYQRCDRFDGTFPHKWNLGDEFRHDSTIAADTGDSAYDALSELILKGQYAVAKERLSDLRTETMDTGLQSLIENDLAVIAALAGDMPAALRGFRTALDLDANCRAAAANLRELADAGYVVESPTKAECKENGRSDPAPEARPIKVAILSFLFNWPSTGGGIVHTVELAQFLATAGYAVRHYHARHAPWGIGEVNEPTPVPSEALTFSTDEWRASVIQERFRSAVEEFAPDYVIITDSWNFKPLLAEAVRGYPYLLRLQALECLCPLNNVRLLPQAEGRAGQCPLHQLATPDECRSCLQERGHTSGSLHQLERALSGVGTADYPEKLRRAFTEADTVLVVNPLAEAMVSPFARQVRVVTAGMDPARFPWPAPPEPGLRTPGKMSILFAGIAEEWMKGFHVLQAAAERLWQRRQDFEVVVTGEAPDTPLPYFRYVGWQSQSALPRYLRACDMLVMPTIAQEALGRTAVEAMASGKPVVASRLGGLPFTVLDGATGLLCEPGDAGDLAEKLATLLDDGELRERLGRAGRRRFEEHYAWPVIIERHYRPLLASRQSSAPVMSEAPIEAVLRSNVVRERDYPLVLYNRTIQLRFPSRGSVDDAILNDLWVRDVYGLRAITEPLECIVDIGAHIGAFSVQAEQLWPDARIIACEADPRNAELLRSNIAERPRIEAIEAAIVADHRDRVDFYAVPDKAAQNSGGGSLLRPEPGSVRIAVPACPVLRLWQDKGIRRCDLLKLDCEGAEVVLLRALAEAGLLADVRWIVGEWHTPDGSESAVDSTMQALRSILAPTHVLTFEERRPGREGHFRASRFGSR